jgi:hypothetical protein
MKNGIAWKIPSKAGVVSGFSLSRRDEADL